MIRKRYIPLLILSFSVLCTGLARPAMSGEYDIKALFLYNFSKYVMWPEFEAAPEFVIGVLGSSKIQEPLQVIADEKKVGDKPIVVQVYESLEEIEDCHILFVAKDKKRELDPILEAVNSRPILTVGETKGYAESGMILNFFMKENKVKFELNRSALEQSGLTASSQLMKLAVLVNEE